MLAPPDRAASPIIIFVVVCAPCALAGDPTPEVRTGSGIAESKDQCGSGWPTGLKGQAHQRRSRSQQPVLEATPPPASPRAPLHLAEALELGNLNRLTYSVVSPGLSDSESSETIKESQAACWCIKLSISGSASCGMCSRSISACDFFARHS